MVSLLPGFSVSEARTTAVGVVKALERIASALEQPIEAAPLDPNYEMLAGNAAGWGDWLEEVINSDKIDAFTRAQSLRDLLENIRGVQRNYEAEAAKQNATGSG